MSIKIWRNGRLVYYASKADKEYWDALWASQISSKYYAKYETGPLDEYFPYFEQHLSKSDRILEAGCGTGRYVLALLARGYKNISGIDWGKPTIDKVKTIYPNLPIEGGDATNVDIENDFYDAYISLGVVEHREAGPEPFLNEAFRILKPGGVALISVPFVNPLRHTKQKLGYFRHNDVKGLSFYQYAFQKAEFANYLEKAGFQVVSSHGVSGIYGLKEELPLLSTFLNNFPCGWRVEILLKKCKFFDTFGHMILFICKKRVLED